MRKSSKGQRLIRKREMLFKPGSHEESVEISLGPFRLTSNWNCPAPSALNKCGTWLSGSAEDSRQLFEHGPSFRGYVLSAARFLTLAAQLLTLTFLLLDTQAEHPFVLALTGELSLREDS